MNNLKLWLLRRLFIWWVNRYGGELRGTVQLEKVMNKLYKSNE